jgi:hypothetical protein
MKRFALLFAVVVAVACLWIGLASAAEHAAAAKPSVTTGEVVCMGCYVGHSAKGEKHAECATKCVTGGMPMGLLTSSGQLYLLTMDHENADAYNKVKEFTGKQAKITGSMHSKNGMKTIDVVGAEEVAMAPAHK